MEELHEYQTDSEYVENKLVELEGLSRLYSLKIDG